jgi:hypothetical protein
VNAPERRSYVAMSAAELDALPVGTVRDFSLNGVYACAEKSENGTWTLLRRQGVPAVALGRCRSAAMAKRTASAQSAHMPAQRRAPAEHLVAMQRVAAASKRASVAT